MKVIGYKIAKSLNRPRALSAYELPLPTLKAHDLLVKINAVSVNPVDVWTYQSQKEVLPKPRVLGFDAVGTVERIGSQVTQFHEGDRVFYAGSFLRNGSYAEYQAVDERIAARAPQNLSDAQAASVPLTALTAWESLFEKMNLPEKAKEGQKQKTVLIINGAGGVGSMAIQLAKWAGARVIATASRKESIDWCRKLGADEVITPHQALLPQIKALGDSGVDGVLELHGLADHWNEFASLVHPLGHIVSVTSSPEKLNLMPLKRKAISFSWEWMFAKSFYGVDLLSQHQILTQVCRLLESGQLKETQTQVLHGLTAETIQKAFNQAASGRLIGKLTIDFD